MSKRKATQPVADDDVDPYGFDDNDDIPATSSPPPLPPSPPAAVAPPQSVLPTEKKAKVAPPTEKKATVDSDADDDDDTDDEKEKDDASDWFPEDTKVSKPPAVLTRLLTNEEKANKEKLSKDPSKSSTPSVILSHEFVIVHPETDELKSPYNLAIKKDIPEQLMDQVKKATDKNGKVGKGVKGWDVILNGEKSSLAKFFDNPMESIPKLCEQPSAFKYACTYITDPDQEHHELLVLIYAYLLEGVKQVMNYFLLNCSPMTTEPNAQAVIKDLTTAVNLTTVKEEKKASSRSKKAQEFNCVFAVPGGKATKAQLLIIHHNLKSPRRASFGKKADPERKCYVNEFMHPVLASIMYVNNFHLMIVAWHRDQFTKFQKKASSGMTALATSGEQETWLKYCQTFGTAFSKAFDLVTHAFSIEQFQDIKKTAALTTTTPPVSSKSSK